jgi:hypothetical protein
VSCHISKQKVLRQFGRKLSLAAGRQKKEMYFFSEINEHHHETFVMIIMSCEIFAIFNNVLPTRYVIKIRRL